MAVSTGNKLAGHMERTKLVVFVSTRRAKTAFTTKRNKFKVTTMSATIHCAAKRRVTTVNHLVDAFHDDITRMKSILNYFIVISKNFL